MFGGFGGQGGGFGQRIEQSLINQFVPGGANGMSTLFSLLSTVH